jgi:tetratricopeptide (TPR) repeat protein
MKAVDLGDPNPSLCYLNAGNRYREMNDLQIALSFYAKAVELNPGQSVAWLSSAQLYSYTGDEAAAVIAYRGFLKWYNNLSAEVQGRPKYRQQAEEATRYIKDHEK